MKSRQRLHHPNLPSSKPGYWLAFSRGPTVPPSSVDVEFVFRGVDALWPAPAATRRYDGRAVRLNYRDFWCVVADAVTDHVYHAGPYEWVYNVVPHRRPR